VFIINYLRKYLTDYESKSRRRLLMKTKSKAKFTKKLDTPPNTNRIIKQIEAKSSFNELPLNSKREQPNESKLKMNASTKSRCNFDIEAPPPLSTATRSSQFYLYTIQRNELEKNKTSTTKTTSRHLTESNLLNLTEFSLSKSNPNLSNI
jgi:hypothetical protein